MTNVKKVNPFARYILNNLLAIDQGMNAIAGGDEDETISSRLGKIQAAHGGEIPVYRPWARLIAHCLDALQKDHCKKAIEADEGKDAVLDREAEEFYEANKPKG
jgi:hypothetical protein